MFTGRLLPHSVQHSGNGGKKGWERFGRDGKGGGDLRITRPALSSTLEINFIPLFTLFWRPIGVK